jgi:hypothetical protein
MRLLRVLGLSIVATFMVSAATSASALAEQLNWKVNGVHLKPGETKPITLKSKGPIQLFVQGGPNIVCKKASGQGNVIGAANSSSFGTGNVTTMSFSKCGVNGEAGCAVEFEFEFEWEAELDGELFSPSTWSYKWKLKIKIKIKPKPAQACAAAGNHRLFGVTDANGPHNQEVQFPVPPLPSSTIAFDGREAVFAGTYKLKLKGRGKLEAG